MQVLKLSKMASACLQGLSELGYEVEAFADFAALDAFLADLGKLTITPKMSPLHNDFTLGNCCWLVLLKDGECSAVCGALFQDLGSESLSEFLKRSTNRQYGTVEVPLVVSDVAGAEVLKIDRRTAYIGELFVPDGMRGNRRVLRHFMLLVQALVALEWGVDHIYALFRKRDLLAKMPYLYGFTDHVPAVMIWCAEVEGRSSDESLASISMPRLLHHADLIANSKDWLGIV
jgi:hypothetical protein